MDEDGQASTTGAGEVRICGSRLLLRAFQPGEVEAEWQAMVDADPMTIAELPDEAGFKARLQRSGIWPMAGLISPLTLTACRLGGSRPSCPRAARFPRGHLR
jgi:hypothetical protein